MAHVTLKASLAAVVAAIVSPVLLAWGGLYAALYWVQSDHPGDPSAGDSVGWMIVFGLPVIVPVLIAVSIVSAMTAFRFTRRKLSAKP